MNAIARRLLARPEARFVLVGLATLIAPLALAFMMNIRTSLGEQTIFLISSVVAVESNFLLNHVFTWRLPRTGRALMRSWTLFHIGKVGTMAVGQALFFSLNIALGFYAAYLSTVLLMAGANYALQRFWIFRTVAVPPKNTERTWS